MKVTIGADPEGFFSDKVGLVPAIGLVGGTKTKPRRCGIGHVQEDNVMWEFNIPPASTEIKFSNSIQAMLVEIEKIGEKHGLGMYYSSVGRFRVEQLLHPQAQTIGCDPDYNAWTHKQNRPASPESLGEIRTASGHVHIGLPGIQQNPGLRPYIARLCDLYLGLPSILIEPVDQALRRKFYGRAGAYRPKPYGIEYRVLGNWWITEDKYRRWVFRQAILVTNQVKHHKDGGIGLAENTTIQDIFNKYNIQSIINTHNIEESAELCKQLGIASP